jgi:cell division protease FtsH
MNLIMKSFLFFTFITSVFSFKPTQFVRNKVRLQMSDDFYGTPWSYNELIENINNHNIEKINFLTDSNSVVALEKVVDNQYKIHTTKLLPNLYEKIVPVLEKNHINYDYLTLPHNEIVDTISSITKGAISISIFFSIYYIVVSVFNNFNRENMNIPGLPNDFSVNNNNNNKLDIKSIDTKFSDVAGCDEAKFELEEVVDFLKNPKRFNEAGAKMPKGVLLEGSPGTGKTLLARAVAGEAGVSFISASGSEFIEMFVGVGASRVRNLFDKAKKSTPCVIFIDEIDAIGRQRGAGIAGGNDEREQTLNQILTNMDGFDKEENIVVIAATNRADILDSALTRPGRFDRKIRVPLPDFHGRKAIFKVHFKNKKINKDVNFDELSALTPGFSGADIANLANEAAIFSVRTNSTTITRSNVFDAYEKITIGLKSNSQSTNKDIIELVSNHEIGHGLLTYLFPQFFDLRKITINSNRGGAGGYTLFTPKEQYSMYPSKKFMLANLIIALGGRAAEVYMYRKKNIDKNKLDDILFEGFKDLHVTTGASNDLYQANNIARDYLTKYGFSDKCNLYDETNSNLPFIGKDLAMSSRKISDSTKYDIDNEVGQLVQYAYNKALELIYIHENEFDELVELIIKKRVLDYKDIKNVFKKK